MSLDGSAIAPASPAIPAAAIIDLNVTPGFSGAGQSSDGMQRKQPRLIPMANLAGAHKLLDEMPPPTPTVDNPDYTQFSENVIYEGRGEAFHVDGQGHAFDHAETQSQDDCGQYGDDQFGAHEEEEVDDHGNSWHEDDDMYSEDEEEEVDIADWPLVFIDELTQRADAQGRKQSIRTGSYTKEEDTLICESWMEIGQYPTKDYPKFKDQYAALKKEEGKAAMADNGDFLKRPRDKSNSKAYEKHDVSSIALQATLHDMMAQKEVRGERSGKGEEEQMKIYSELQTKKLDKEEAAMRRKLDIEEAAQSKKLTIKATNVDTKAREVALAIMSVDKTNMSPKRNIWFVNRQKKMFKQDGLNQGGFDRGLWPFILKAG
ncbi:hypothetical protein VPH35_097256 [Triticum aestivum]